MKSSRFTSAVFCLTGLLVTGTLAGCGGAAEGAGDPGEQEKIGQEAAALSACGAPIQGYASWIAANPGSAYVSALVQGGSFHDVTMWIDQQSLLYHPGFCFRSCSPGYFTYTISGDLFGAPITIGSTGNMTLGSANVQVTPTSCTETVPGTTTITGTDADGNTYTVTLVEQYLG